MVLIQPLGRCVSIKTLVQGILPNRIHLPNCRVNIDRNIQCGIISRRNSFAFRCKHIIPRQVTLDCKMPPNVWWMIHWQSCSLPHVFVCISFRTEMKNSCASCCVSGLTVIYILPNASARSTWYTKKKLGSRESVDRRCTN
jgi:hypothetical protein